MLLHVKIELPENQNQTVQLQQQPPAKTDLPATVASGGASTNVNSSAGVFASIFASSSAAAGLTQSSQSPSSYSDLLCAMAGSDRSTVEPMSLSLSSPFYLTNTASSLFPTAGQDHLPRYTMSPQPALSATALLQKAAQIGATSSNSSFLRGFGLAMPSSSDHHQNTSGAGAAVVPTATTPWNGSHVKLEIPTENSFMSSGFGLGLHSQGYNNEPTTLDLLGLGLGVGGTPSNGFSAFFTSMGGDLSIAAATAAAAPPYGGLNTAMENWVKSPDRKPSML